MELIISLMETNTQVSIVMASLGAVVNTFGLRGQSTRVISKMARSKAKVGGRNGSWQRMVVAKRSSFTMKVSTVTM